MEWAAGSEVATVAEVVAVETEEERAAVAWVAKMAVVAMAKMVAVVMAMVVDLEEPSMGALGAAMLMRWKSERGEAIETETAHANVLHVHATVEAGVLAMVVGARLTQVSMLWWWALNQSEAGSSMRRRSR